jgi:hypothetical protein
MILFPRIITISIFDATSIVKIPTITLLFTQSLFLINISRPTINNLPSPPTSIGNELGGRTCPSPSSSNKPLPPPNVHGGGAKREMGGGGPTLQGPRGSWAPTCPRPHALPPPQAQGRGRGGPTRAAAPQPRGWARQGLLARLSWANPAWASLGRPNSLEAVGAFSSPSQIGE